MKHWHEKGKNHIELLKTFENFSVTRTKDKKTITIDADNIDIYSDGSGTGTRGPFSDSFTKEDLVEIFEELVDWMKK